MSIQTLSNQQRIVTLAAKELDAFCYAADSLPEASSPAWTTSYFPDPIVNGTIEINPAGKLHISTLAVDAEQATWTLSGLPWNDVDGLTVEITMKMVTGDTILGASVNTLFSIDSGTTGAGIQFYTDGVVLSANTDTSYAIDTTNDYHTYLVSIQNGIAKLYVDGVLRVTDNTYAGASPSMSFQAIDGQIDHESYWDSICTDTIGRVKSKRLSDQLIKQYGTARKSELISKIGNNGEPYEKLLNDSINS